nr:hypothetical protein [Tanacetum cinerariifolium]
SYAQKTEKPAKKIICYNCRGEGHVARQCNEPKRAKDTKYFKDMVMLSEARDRGVHLDAEAEAFLAGMECTEPLDGPLAITTTTAFKVEHKDIYDLDVDDGPHANVAFMANLSATDEQGTSSSQPQEIANENRELGEDNSRLTTTIIQQNESIQ